MSSYAGGEYLCLVVCEALQEIGYRVNLASTTYDPKKAETIYGMGGVLTKCSWVRIPDFKVKRSPLTPFQQIRLSLRLWNMFKQFDADVAISSQPSPFRTSRRLFQFVYNADDLFSYPRFAAPFTFPTRRRGPRKIYLTLLGLLKGALWSQQGTENYWLFGVGGEVTRALRNKGYLNSSSTFPPCRTNFKPRFPKRRQVVQFARIIPEKRLELYSRLALSLPAYDFILVGRRDEVSDRIYPGYADALLSNLPPNMTYVESSVRERPDLLEESQIYVYTGLEPGIVLSVVEAISAGCVPYAPTGTGAAEILKEIGAGIVYQSIEEAANSLRLHLADKSNETESVEISEKAHAFSPESFKKWIQYLVTLDPSSRVPDYHPNVP